MKALVTNGFSIGKLTGLTWDEIDGYAAEATYETGDVCYRDHYVCTAFNDDDGGDTLDENDNPISDEQIQARITKIDAGER
jgi:hypothetical protein